MIVASIDIGTNTVLLLIAEVDPKSNKLTPLRNEYRLPRIGQNIKETGVISLSKVEELTTILNEYNNIIQSYFCECTLVTGTNVFRLAKNTNQISEIIKQKFNFDLNVISGDEEAEYAFLGAVSGSNLASTKMVIDVGGSSTEIIIAIDDKIISKWSLQLGSVTASEEFFLHSPPSELEIENLKSEIKQKLLTVDITEKSENVIAVAGTATTLACMILGMKEFKEEKVDNKEVSLNDVKHIFLSTKDLNASQILDRYGSIMLGREDIILAGIYIFYNLMYILNINKIKVSTRGIRYGAIMKYVQSLPQ